MSEIDRDRWRVKRSKTDGILTEASQSTVFNDKQQKKDVGMNETPALTSTHHHTISSSPATISSRVREGCLAAPGLLVDSCRGLGGRSSSTWLVVFLRETDVPPLQDLVVLLDLAQLDAGLLTSPAQLVRVLAAVLEVAHERGGVAVLGRHSGRAEGWHNGGKLE